MCTKLKSDEIFSKFKFEKISETLQEKALHELRETPENIQKGLKDLKTLLAAEKDLTVPLTNDKWLLMFLRTCKFYPESARDLIKRFYGIRFKYSEVTNLLLPSKLRPVFDNNLTSFLPQTDQFGRRIILTMGGKQWNFKLIPSDDLFSSSILCTDFLQNDQESQVNGVVYILDLEGFSFGHLLQYTPYNVKRCLEFTQGNAALRIKGVHIVNQPKIFQPIFAAIKPFFDPKFAKRAVMHGHNYKSLHQYIAPECLPKCYGGTLDDTQLMFGRETYQLLADYEEFFEFLQGFGYKKL